ncbi:MAG: flagellar hook-basal body complex protein FliE [Pseudomonadota bacterium]
MKFHGLQAAQSYAAARSAFGPAPPASQKNAGSEGAAFEALHQLAGAVAKGEEASVAYMTGGADPHSVVEAMAAAELAIETATTIRDKVVEAYQEILRMPV